MDEDSPGISVEDSIGVARVGTDGSVRVTEELRDSYGLDEGDQVLLVPTGKGILLRTLELPTVGEYGEWVERNAGELGIPADEVEKLLYRYLAGSDAAPGLVEYVSDRAGAEKDEGES